MTNSEMEEKVKARFSTDAPLKAANLSVYANIDHNAITLSGTVESVLLRIRATEFAKNTSAGFTIVAQIDVKPGELSRTAYTKELAREECNKAKERGETVGDSLDDSWVHPQIVAKLMDTSTTPERKIGVDVTHNVVTLRGRVENAEQKTKAERIAQNTEGVKSVNNHLRVEGATEKRF